MKDKILAFMELAAWMERQEIMENQQRVRPVLGDSDCAQGLWERDGGETLVARKGSEDGDT